MIQSTKNILGMLGSLIVLTVVLIGVGSLKALAVDPPGWTSPSQNPANGNVAAPLNVGNNIQQKGTSVTNVGISVPQIQTGGFLYLNQLNQYAGSPTSGLSAVTDARPALIFGALDKNQSFYFGAPASVNDNANSIMLFKWNVPGGVNPIMQIWQNDGKVGIGTGNPAYQLDVAGGPINAGGGLIIQTVASDPGSPETGRMWLITP